MFLKKYCIEISAAFSQYIFANFIDVNNVNLIQKLVLSYNSFCRKQITQKLISKIFFCKKEIFYHFRIIFWQSNFHQHLSQFLRVYDINGFLFYFRFTEKKSKNLKAMPLRPTA